MKWSFHTAVFVSLVALTQSASAGYLSILESGEVLPAGQYQFGIAPQLLLNEGGGADVDAYVDAPFSDAGSFRVLAGGGKVDFHIGGAVKYVPFPDVDNQPAIGLRAALWYARVSEVNVMTLQLAPLLSRKVETDAGLFVPYAALALDFTSAKDDNHTGVQFVGGSEWKTPDVPNMTFAAEVALNLNKSYSALNLSVAFPFDGEHGFKKR